MVQVLIIVGHAVVGRALCGATMMLSMKTTSPQRALVIHAVAAPLIFVALSWVYFSQFGHTGPLVTAAIFVALVVLLDLLIVVPFIEKSFAMFRSFSGTWLPFALMFLATWITGIALR
jgi:hypothetical protein